MIGLFLSCAITAVDKKRVIHTISKCFIERLAFYSGDPKGRVSVVHAWVRSVDISAILSRRDYFLYHYWARLINLAHTGLYALRWLGYSKLISGRVGIFRLVLLVQ